MPISMSAVPRLLKIGGAAFLAWLTLWGDWHSENSFQRKIVFGVAKPFDAVPTELGILVLRGLLLVLAIGIVAVVVWNWARKDRVVSTGPMFKLDATGVHGRAASTPEKEVTETKPNVPAKSDTDALERSVSDFKKTFPYRSERLRKRLISMLLRPERIMSFDSEAMALLSDGILRRIGSDPPLGVIVELNAAYAPVVREFAIRQWKEERRKKRLQFEEDLRDITEAGRNVLMLFAEPAPNSPDEPEHRVLRPTEGNALSRLLHVKILDGGFASGERIWIDQDALDLVESHVLNGPIKRLSIAFDIGRIEENVDTTGSGTGRDRP